LVDSALLIAKEKVVWQNLPDKILNIAKNLFQLLIHGFIMLNASKVTRNIV